MYFAIMLFWVTIISMVVISLLTKEPDSYRVRNQILIRMNEFLSSIKNFFCSLSEPHFGPDEIDQNERMK